MFCFFVAFQSLQHRLGRLNRTEISGVTSQSVTSCSAHPWQTRAQAQTQTLPFKAHFSRLDLIRSLARTRACLPKSIPLCRICCAQRHREPSGRPHPSALQVSLITGPSLSPTSQTQPLGWLPSPTLFTTAAWFLQSLISFSVRRVSASCPHAHGVAALRARTAPVVCICGDIFKHSQWRIYTGLGGEVAVFCPSCLFTITLSAGCRGRWWMQTIRGRAFSFNSEKLNLKYQNILTTFPSQFRKSGVPGPTQTARCLSTDFSSWIPSSENIAI